MADLDGVVSIGAGKRSKILQSQTRGDKRKCDGIARQAGFLDNSAGPLYESH